MQTSIVALTFAAGIIAGAQAQTYPSRPITLVVPIAAGGAVDTSARIVAEKLQDKLGQPVAVENRTGAGGMIGTTAVAKALPDGYTLLLIESAAVLSKWLHKQVSFDIATDFVPIAKIASTPLGLFAQPTLPANDVKELIAHSKANPGKLSVGIPGIGSPHHLAALMLNAAAKIDIAQVAYRGSAPALNDLLGGQIPLMWSTPIPMLPFIEQGKVKTLGISTRERLSILPRVPTIAENAVSGFHIEAWVGMAAPAKVPVDVVRRIEQAVREVLELPDVQRRMAAVGFRLDFRNSEKFRELIMAEHEKYGVVIREAGLQPN